MASLRLFNISCPKTNRDSSGGSSNELYRRSRLSRLKIKRARSTATRPIMRTIMSAVVDGVVLPKRTYIPCQMELADCYWQGVMIDAIYTQTVVIRSYEVGADKKGTPQSILYLLQDTALNHAQMTGLVGEDGFGATHGMTKNNLIWVITKMQLQVDIYPIWGDILVIETWIGASGRNGMRRDWEIRSHKNGNVLARATSTLVMMNRKTRRLSKMPDEVRTELSPLFIKKQVIMEDVTEQIEKLNDNATYVNSAFLPKWSHLDMNEHVNSVKYVEWMLEMIPNECLKFYQLQSIMLIYRKECGTSDVIQSLCQPEKVKIIEDAGDGDNNDINMNSEATGLLSNCLTNEGTIKYTHLLQMKGESKWDETVRGTTTWKKK